MSYLGSTAMTLEKPAIVRLKPGREASVVRRHPWIFSGAIGKVQGSPASGDLVRVFSADDRLLGVGGFSPNSQIRVRLFSFCDVEINPDYFSRQIERAIKRRHTILNHTQRSAFRLVYGESDDLPGLIVDKYSDFLVCQFLFAGIEPWKSTLVDILAEQSGCCGIFERSDASSRLKEGLPKTSGVVWGEQPPETLLINEHEMYFGVDVAGGQKTGFYLDQVENRQFVQQCSKDKTVLNCFSYTGAFSVAALKGGASHAISVDASAAALQLAIDNVARNDIDQSRHTAVEGNAFNVLRSYQQAGQQFDMVILDPPKFAENKKQVPKAARAYKDLSLQASKLIAPGGLLITFSCSGAIDMNLFQKITADALQDAKRHGEIVRYLHQGADHPIALGFPESQYLKGLVCRVN